MTERVSAVRHSGRPLGLADFGLTGLLGLFIRPAIRAIWLAVGRE